MTGSTLPVRSGASTPTRFRKGWVNAQLSAIVADFAARCLQARCSGKACFLDSGPYVWTCTDHICAGHPLSCFAFRDAATAADARMP